MDEILDGQTDIFDLLGPHELETQPPQIIETVKHELAQEDTP